MAPCAACKYLRRKCTQECIFAPFFQPEETQKFKCVHEVYGASNVAKLLNDLPFNQRGDAVISLVYEAQARLLNPVHGLVGLVSTLQHRLTQLQHELENSRKELATYVGPQAMLPIFQPPQPYSMSLPPQFQLPYSSSASVLTQLHQQQQQQILEAQQLAAVNAVAREQQNERIRAFGEGTSSAVTRIPLGDNLVPTGQSYHQQQQLLEAQQLAAVNAVARGKQKEIFRDFGEGSSTAVTKMPLGDNFASYYHHQQQHHEAQLIQFIPTQYSQPLPLQTQETQTETQPNSESEERVIGFISQNKE